MLVIAFERFCGAVSQMEIEIEGEANKRGERHSCA